MTRISRRDFFAQAGGFIAAGAISAVCRPVPIFAQDSQHQPKPSEAEAEAIAKAARQFMDKCRVPGLSVSFARHGEVVYEAGFGHADDGAGEGVTPAHLFRIASVSKPITSVAVFTLIEKGRLKLEDRVFGAGGVLGFDYGDSLPERVRKITMRHLLTHTGGGWRNDGDDPMFRNKDMDHQELIAWTLRNQPLKDEPGQNYAYSNFGYCILGRVVEKASGRRYAEYVRQAVLEPCGIRDMQLAGNTLVQRAHDEVVYYDRDRHENPYNMNVTRMDSHGGWIATPGDLVRFALRVGGSDTVPNLLRPETIKTMLTASAANAGYACGWFVNRVPNFWHTGNLPGTTSIMVRTASGLCWAAFANARADGSELALDQMMWQMARAVPAWRA
jgi:CubicO group peptidase (beta-lactamase class C family)